MRCSHQAIASMRRKHCLFGLYVVLQIAGNLAVLHLTQFTGDYTMSAAFADVFCKTSFFSISIFGHLLRSSSCGVANCVYFNFKRFANPPIFLSLAFHEGFEEFNCNPKIEQIKAL